MFKRRNKRKKQPPVVNMQLANFGAFLLMLYIVYATFGTKPSTKETPGTPTNLTCPENTPPIQIDTSFSVPPLPLPTIQLIKPGTGIPLRCGDKTSIHFEAFALSGERVTPMEGITQTFTLTPQDSDNLWLHSLPGNSQNSELVITAPATAIHLTDTTEGNIALHTVIRSITPKNTPPTGKHMREILKQGDGQRIGCGDRVEITQRSLLPKGQEEVRTFTIGKSHPLEEKEHLLYDLRVGSQVLLLSPDEKTVVKITVENVKKD